MPHISQRFFTLAMLCLLSTFVAGCESIKDAYMVDSLTKEKSDRLLNDHDLLLGDQYVPTAIDIYIEPFPGDPNPTNLRLPVATPTGIACAADHPGDPRYYATNGQECRSAYAYAIADTSDTTARDSLMDFLINRSDRICSAHKAGIISTGHEVNFGLSETATVLGGLGALFTPAATARALSGSSAIVNATRDNFNQVFYQNLLATAVVKSIDATRLQMRSVLDGHRGKDKDIYSVNKMIADVEDYHSACSFYEGLVSLTSAASRVTASTDEISARITQLQSQRESNLDQIQKLQALTFAAGSEADKARNKSIVDITSNVGRLNSEIGQLQTELAVVPSAGGAPAVAVPLGS